MKRIMPKIVFVNGLYQNKNSWSHIQERLHMFESLTFDFPNQTQVDLKPELSNFSQYADYAEHKIKKASQSGREVIGIGLSSGANILRYLHDNRGMEFLGLILLSPNPGGLSVFYSQYVNSLLRSLKEGGVESFVDVATYVSFSASFFEKSAYTSSLINSQFKKLYGGNEECLRALIHAAASDPTLKEPPTNFRCNTRIFRGEDDYLIPEHLISAYVQTCTNNVSLSLISGGHSFIFEHPEQSSELIAEAVHNLCI